jgi:hypothetical protein
MGSTAAVSSGPLLRAALAVASVTSFALALAGAQRVRLESKFVAGETLRYRIEARTTTTGKTTTPIANPEGGSKSQQNVRLLIRLDVLGGEPAANLANAANASSTASAPKAVRFRATYEESHVDVDSDALDLAAVSLEDSYDRIEGRSVEFTLSPEGRLGAIQGLDTIFPNPSNAGPVLAWLDGLLSLPHLPQDGIAVGQKWSSERPLVGAALDGLTWRTESSYLRNDACSVPVIPAALADLSANPPGSCAVILMHFKISRSGSAHSDATPPEYRQNGLRTSGTWTGSGDGLESISLASGLLVTATETSTQDMDYEVKSASAGSAIHRQSHVQTQSQITLVPSA